MKLSGQNRGLVKVVACVMLSGVVLANSLRPVSAEELGEVSSTQNSIAARGSTPSVGDLSLPTTAKDGEGTIRSKRCFRWCSGVIVLPSGQVISDCSCFGFTHDHD
ncbi:hypothetical protein [Pasteuria penetrans]|uniref:hypothetical protein n=1 Tax=Pasteuria penetrans TaxID=86005 RepID=UPI000F981C46|nr:hypothetical protein [Pasteuria penetrans]